MLGFDHGVDYTVYQRRPLIEVELAAVAADGRLLGSKSTVLLVDSGADTSTLDAALAPALGIDLSAVPAEEFTAAGGGKVQAWQSPVQILARLCGQWIPIPVDFCANQQPGLLGREGAFDALRIAFLHSLSVMVAATHP